MAEDTKKCPKCSGDMKPTTVVCSIPALSPNNPVGAVRVVFPVVPYACLECRFVELYHLPSEAEKFW